MPVNNLEHRRNRRNVDDRERTAGQCVVGVPPHATITTGRLKGTEHTKWMNP